jgi:hypothetical protein
MGKIISPSLYPVIGSLAAMESSPAMQADYGEKMVAGA